MKAILIFIFLNVLVSCNQEIADENQKTIYVVCSIQDQNAGKCLRYMERKIYLAFADTNPLKNNVFQKNTVVEAMEEIACLSDLGCGYFSFTEIDSTFITPLSDATSSGTSFKSFVQIYPDLEFRDLADRFNFAPDQNVLTIVNKANKRQFYMILRASCFDTNDTRCTNDNSVIMGAVGVKALIARSLVLLVGAPLDCSNGVDNTMCPDFPSQEQWNLTERQNYRALFNSQLEIIRLNPGVYEEFVSETSEAP